MKKTKLTLISAIVCITMFCLTVIFDIQIPTNSNRYSQDETNGSTTTGTNISAEITGEAKIHSLSINISPIPSIVPQELATAKEDVTKDEETPSSLVVESDGEIQEPEVTPTLAPETTAQTNDKEEEVQKKPQAKYTDIGISIAKKYVNIREKASTDSTVLGKLYKGSAATILDKKDDWYYVESGSVEGYVSSQYIKTGIPDDELMDKYGTLSVSVAVDGLNVRSEPSTDSKKVTVIYKQEIYPVIEEIDDWLKVKITDENKSGYIKKEYAEILVKFDEAVSREEEEKLEQLAAEERAKKETQIQYSGGTSYSSDDLKLLACLVHSEAGSQSYESKLAVANIVLNRVKSSKYANSIKAVIYQKGQFSVAASGSLQKQLNNYKNYDSKSQKLSIKAAKDALQGANNIGKRLYFHSYSTAVRKGYDDKSTSVKIGALLFWQ